MPTTTFAAQRTRLNPLTLWHLLSLDAPSVASVWLIFAARATHTSIPRALPLAMFLAVWLLYATDRLLDARSPTEILEPRHHFHATHRTPFAFAILVASSGLAILVPILPVALLRPYLVLAAALLVWFILIHLTRMSLPKEIVPGLFFAAAVAIPTHLSPAPAAAFALLCMLNCLYIYAWENPHPHSPHRVTRMALPILTQLGVALAAVPVLMLGATPFSTAITLAAIALLGLSHFRARLSRTTLRAAADLALLTPVLVLPFLR